MAKSKADSGTEDMLDVRSAAALLGCHPETVRRWVWSGRLVARRHGNRLLLARSDVEAMASRRAVVIGLAEWSELARAARVRRGSRGSGDSAAELVIENRASRSRDAGALAGR